MKGGIGNLVKQAQQMQQNMKQMQEHLAAVEIEGQSGSGRVKVTMTCRHIVKRVSIDQTLLEEDKELLEDLVAAAINDAERKIDAAVQDKISGIAAGAGLPPGFKLPF